MQKELGGFKGKSVIDVGCGDGRHLAFFDSIGFSSVCGTEISEEICQKTRDNLKLLGVSADVRVGSNDKLGFDDEMVDVMSSWNVCYYMSGNNKRNFCDHVVEYARALKPGGTLVFYIPCIDCFVYKDGFFDNGYMTIKYDWCGVRNGSVQKVFENQNQIIEAFSPRFHDFFGRIIDEWFGLSFHGFVGKCIRY